MELSFGTVLTASAAMMLCSPLTLSAAGPYPARPIRMIVPFAPGGASDFVARIVEPRLARELGQHVVVENRAGASGYIGIELAAQATPDGYTVLLGNIGTMAINPSVFPRFTVQPLAAFTAVSQVVDVPGCLVVHPSLPVRTIPELIDYAKARPGSLNYSAAGAGSNSRLAFEYFMRRTGMNVVMVAYKGGAGGAALGVAQGEVQMTMLTSASVLPFVRSGRVRLVAVIAPRRLEAAPEIPTMSEGGFPDLTVGSWQGLYVPKGTPASIVARLFTATRLTMQDPEVGRQLGTASALVVLSQSPQQFHQFWRNEHDRWSKVVREINAVAH